MINIEKLKIAIIVSQYNAEITTALKIGVVKRLIELGVIKENIVICEVPGAVEIPLIAKTLAHHKKYNAIIALGSVVRGETTHYDLVCQQVSFGCQQIALEFEIPIIFGVLTTENEEQAFARLGGEHGHKGIEAADSAINMCLLMHELRHKE